MRLEAAIEHSKGNALCDRQITQAFRHDDLISQLAKFRGLLELMVKIGCQRDRLHCCSVCHVMLSDVGQRLKPEPPGIVEKYLGLENQEPIRLPRVRHVFANVISAKVNILPT